MDGFRAAKVGRGAVGVRAASSSAIGQVPAGIGFDKSSYMACSHMYSRIALLAL